MYIYYILGSMINLFCSQVDYKAFFIAMASLTTRSDSQLQQTAMSSALHKLG